MSDRVEFPPLHTALCASHLGKVVLELPPLQAYQPFLMLGLCEAAMYTPEVLAATGLDLAGGQRASFKRLTSALREYSPLCCLIGEEQLRRLIRALRGGRVNFQIWRHETARPKLLEPEGD